MTLVPLKPALLACRQIDQVDSQLGAALGLDPQKHRSLGLVTCDQDDSTYIALDHATKFARVDVKFARSFYAGSKHASGPFSGEILGVVAAENPEEIAEALWAIREILDHGVHFSAHAGHGSDGADQPAFLSHVIAETGHYLSAEAGLRAGEPMAYLIAPPLESVIAVDAALKAARVKLLKHIPPPSETNFGGAFLGGDLPSLEAAAAAFTEAIGDFAKRPLAAATRPAYLRR